MLIDSGTDGAPAEPTCHIDRVQAISEQSCQMRVLNSALIQYKDVILLVQEIPLWR